MDVYVANLNAPDQCVVGGTRTDLAQLATALTSQGRQAKMLAVPGAFHTPLLSTASRPLEEALRGATIAAPQVKFVSTVNNSVIGDPAEIRRNLARQLTTPVRYAQLIGRLASRIADGVCRSRPATDSDAAEPADSGFRCRRHRQRQSQTIGLGAAARRSGTFGMFGGLPGESSENGSAGRQPAAAQPAANEPAATQPTARRAEWPNRRRSRHRNHPTTTAPLTATKGTTALSDQRSTPHEIPHFDATERRREKMRSANGPAGSAGCRQPGSFGRKARCAKQPPTAAKPASAGRETGRRVAQTPAARPAAGTGQGSRGGCQAPPGEPGGPQGNGASNGSASHHTAARRRGRSGPAPQGRLPPASRSSRRAPQAAGSPGKSAAELEAFLINFVVEQTGYPAEVVDLDADLEADLGIDSIKKAQLFGELQEYFDIAALGAGNATGGSLSLDDFTTLRHVLNFLVKSTSRCQRSAAGR